LAVSHNFSWTKADSQECFKKPTIMPVKEKCVFIEGGQSLEIYRIDGDRHAADLMMVYIPKAKILVEADDFTSSTPQVPTPTGVRPAVFSANLMKNVQRLKLDVTTMSPLHGVVVPFSDFQKKRVAERDKRELGNTRRAAGHESCFTVCPAQFAHGCESSDAHSENWCFRREFRYSKGTRP
jgi:hypothetical protein